MLHYRYFSLTTIATLVLAPCWAAQATCPTIWTTVQSSTRLTMEHQSLKRLGHRLLVPLLSSLDVNITVFILSDKTLYERLYSNVYQDVWMNFIFDGQPPIEALNGNFPINELLEELDRSPKILSLAFFGMLRGVYDSQDLMNVTINSLLGELVGQFLPLQFHASPDGEVTMSGFGGVSGRISKPKYHCNGVLYAVDGCAVPVKHYSDLPELQEGITVADIARIASNNSFHTRLRTSLYDNISFDAIVDELYPQQDVLPPSRFRHVHRFKHLKLAIAFFGSAGFFMFGVGCGAFLVLRKLRFRRRNRGWPGMVRSDKRRSFDTESKVIKCTPSRFFQQAWCRKRSANLHQEMLSSFSDHELSLDSDMLSDTTITLPTSSEYSGKQAAAMSPQSSSSPLELLLERDPSFARLVQSWEIPSSDIVILTDGAGKRILLGKGGFGEVYRGTWCGSTPVAVKYVAHSANREEYVKQLAKEIAVLKECRNPHIVQFYGANVTEGDLMLVTEYMPRGDLYHAMQSHQGAQYTWKNRGRMIALDIARGISYLHSQRIVHCDIKSPNILLTDGMRAKIADMGMAHMLVKDYVTRSAIMGTLAWAAPELLMNSKITEKVDIFSFGVLLWEIVTADIPMRGQLKPLRPGVDCSAALIDLMDQCLAPEPEDRPTALQVYDSLLEIIKLEHQAANNTAQDPLVQDAHHG